jgi:hypothetical protein
MKNISLGKIQCRYGWQKKNTMIYPCYYKPSTEVVCPGYCDYFFTYKHLKSVSEKGVEQSINEITWALERLEKLEDIVEELHYRSLKIKSILFDHEGLFESFVSYPVDEGEPRGPTMHVVPRIAFGARPVSQFDYVNMMFNGDVISTYYCYWRNQYNTFYRDVYLEILGLVRTELWEIPKGESSVELWAQRDYISSHL